MCVRVCLYVCVQQYVHRSLQEEGGWSVLHPLPHVIAILLIFADFSLVRVSQSIPPPSPPRHLRRPNCCRNTLCSEPMVDFMQHNVLVWGGSLMHGEAYAVGNALDACAFPYVGLLLCKQNQVQVL